MTPDSMSATLALVIIAATIVARVVTSRLIANTRFGLHAWEREHQALLTKLAVIRGQREMVNRDRVRFIHDRSALCEAVQSLRVQLRTMEEESERRRRQLARTVTMDRVPA